MTLADQTCVPCQGDIPPLDEKEIGRFISKIDSNWHVMENIKIKREFLFRSFSETLDFVNTVADLAEAMGHHPDFFIHYNRLTIELWTHKIKGLHDNDFIMAAKIDQLYSLSK